MCTLIESSFKSYQSWRKRPHQSLSAVAPSPFPRRGSGCSSSCLPSWTCSWPSSFSFSWPVPLQRQRWWLLFLQATGRQWSLLRQWGPVPPPVVPVSFPAQGCQSPLVWVPPVWVEIPLRQLRPRFLPSFAFHANIWNSKTPLPRFPVIIDKKEKVHESLCSLTTTTRPDCARKSPNDRRNWSKVRRHVMILHGASPRYCFLQNMAWKDGDLIKPPAPHKGRHPANSEFCGATLSQERGRCHQFLHRDD
mmetsp:Transcript_23367/g.64986  ORF Transcript_23367/g.64986 Transcript_23367/m.64986 type:complete len:249 (+) Transcript_23367:49-795(+)